MQRRTRSPSLVQVMAMMGLSQLAANCRYQCVAGLDCACRPYYGSSVDGQPATSSERLDVLRRGQESDHRLGRRGPRPLDQR